MAFNTIKQTTNIPINYLFSFRLDLSTYVIELNKQESPYNDIKDTGLGLGELELWCVMPFLTIFQLYLVEDPPKNHLPVASHWQALSHNVVSNTSTTSGIRTHNFSGSRHWLHKSYDDDHRLEYPRNLYWHRTIYIFYDRYCEKYLSLDYLLRMRLFRRP